MVGSMLFSRPLGGFMSSKKKNGSAPLLNYSEMEESYNESFYEEIIVDDDGEEYIEEIIEEDDTEDPNAKSLSDLRATQEQVDSMSLNNAKQYLLALPQATGPTSVPVTTVDDDYEYEEIEIVDAITPIRRSRRSTFFVPPALDDILEESEHTERSVASSLMMNSPNISKQKQAMPRNLSNITEGHESSAQYHEEVLPTAPLMESSSDIHATRDSTEQSPQQDSEEGPSPDSRPGSQMALDPDGEQIDEVPEEEQEVATTTISSDESDDPPKVFIGELNDTKPPVSNRSISRSNKSIQSESTETTMSESGSNTSLDIRQVFGLSSPPASPHHVPKRRVGNPTELNPSSTSSRANDASLGKNLNRLSDTGHSTGRGNSSRHREDGDNQSVMSSRSRRTSKRSSSGRISSKTSEERAQTVEAEILALLSPELKKKSSLDDLLSLESSSTPKQQPHRDSDDHSVSARSVRSSGARRRSSRIAPSETSRSTPTRQERQRDDEGDPLDAKSHSRSSRSTDSGSKEKSPSSNKTMQSSLKEGSKSLDALLARLPSEPQKRSDARSTASGLLRSSRGRTRDSDRDCRSVVGSSTTKPPRARSARRVKKGDGDDASVVSMSAASSSRPRARSTSIGRKERLRRNRRQEETERANRKFQEELKMSRSSTPTKGKSGSPRVEGRKTPESHRGQVRRSSSSRDMDDNPSSYRSEKDSSYRSEKDSSYRSEKDSSYRSEKDSSYRSEKDSSYRSEKGEKPSSSSSRRNDKDDHPSSRRSTSSRGDATRSSHGSTRDSSSRTYRAEENSLDMNESRGSISKSSSRSKSRTRGGTKDEGHSKHSHSTSTRSSTRRSTGSSDAQSKGSHGERRSSRESEDFMDEMDGNASFHRTLMLARSLHSNDDGSVDNDLKTPRRSSGQKKENHDASTTDRESARERSEEHKTPRPSRRSFELGEGSSRAGYSRRGDNTIPVHAVHDSERQKLRLSDVANAMREAPKAAKSPREHHPEPLKKKHSSDDILLMSPGDSEYTRTPSAREHRTLPSRSMSNRTPTSRPERRVPYHSPETKKKYLVSPSSEQHSRAHLPRSRSDGTTESPTKMTLSRHRQRTSEIQPTSPMTSSPTTYGSSQTPTRERPARRNSIDVHSPSSSSSPAVTPGRARRRCSMDMPSPSSASSSTSHRRSSLDMRSPLPPLAPSLGTGPTPFERLSELEKIKQFLTGEEYEQKKKEILASI